MHNTILAPNKGTKNQVRQPADVDSCRKTETKDPNFKEGDTEKY